MNSNSNILKLIVRLQRNILPPCTTYASASSSSRCVIGAQFDQHRHASGRSPVPLMGLGKGEIPCIIATELFSKCNEIKSKADFYVLFFLNLSAVSRKTRQNQFRSNKKNPV